MRKLLFFTGRDCPSCDVVKKHLFAIMDRDKLDLVVEILEINKGENARRAADFAISSIPAVVVLDDDKPIYTFIGSTIIERLEDEGII